MTDRDYLRRRLQLDIEAKAPVQRWSNLQTLTTLYTSEVLEESPDTVFVYRALAQDVYNGVIISPSLWKIISDGGKTKDVVDELSRHEGMFDSGIFQSMVRNVPAVVLSDRLTNLHEQIVRLSTVVSTTNQRGVSFSDRVGLMVQLEEVETRIAELKYEFSICVNGMEMIRQSISEEVYDAPEDSSEVDTKEA